MRIRFAAEAFADLDGHIEYYGQRSIQAKQTFLVQLDQILQLVDHHPEIAPRVQGDVRRFTMRNYTVAIYYSIETAEDIVVVGILHLRRNPEIIDERLENQ